MVGAMSRHFFNLHAHAPPAAPDEVAVVSLSPTQPPLGHAGLFSVGIHPWQVNEERLTADISAVEIMAGESRCAAVGEIGLDKLRGPSIELQARAFKAQIELAATLGKPVIIHCVRAQNEILDIRSGCRGMQWVIHGFRGKPAAAQRYIDCGISVSFGVHILSPKEDQTRESLRGVPADLLFFETDESHLPVSEVYAAAAEVRGCEVEALRQAVWENATRTFGVK